MPCCTYLSDYEVGKWRALLTDDALAQLLDEVNARQGERWAIHEQHNYKTLRWWHIVPRKGAPLYTLYSHIAAIEWQVINFPGGTSSINLRVEAPMVHCYMLGYLGGLAASKRTRSGGH